MKAAGVRALADTSLQASRSAAETILDRWRKSKKTPEEGPALLMVIRRQAQSLFETARDVGLTGREIVELVSAEGRPFVEENVREGYATPEEGLIQLLKAEGGCVDSNEARILFRPPAGVSRQTISEKIRLGELIAYKTGGGTFQLPRWQFRPEGGLIEGMPQVLEKIRGTLPNSSSLFAFTFFLQADPVTEGRTPLEALRKGKLQQVLDAVGGYR